MKKLSKIKPLNKKLGTYVPKKKYSEITYEVLEQFLKDMVPTEPPVIFMAYCKTRGFTKFTAGTGLCGDPECGICPGLKKSMKEYIHKL